MDFINPVLAHEFVEALFLRAVVVVFPLLAPCFDCIVAVAVLPILKPFADRHSGVEEGAQVIWVPIRLSTFRRPAAVSTTW